MMTEAAGQSERDYGGGHLSHSLPTELRRLRALEHFGDPGTYAALNNCGIQAGWRGLELGAGAGSIACWLAERCAPGQVVATDLDTRFLPQDVPNITTLKHDVLREEFPPNSFEIVHARALLEHLSEREQVLARMVDWTAQGGWVCVDGFIALEPPPDSPNPYHRCMSGLISLSSHIQADPRWAASLPRLLSELGLRDVGSLCTPGHVGPGGNADAFFRLTLDQIAPALLGHGFVTEQDLSDCSRVLETEGYVDLSFLQLSVFGRRSP
ncbi:class I SAM-dependent methyltransferase [Streptomyces sp. IBSNAI002]|uniref:class I SAM-dependent methyltransferase n=1 Tax=Streptomyces sp. IBSNAI002 TaxID=3457500 RepID=UPI003FCF5A05